MPTYIKLKENAGEWQFVLTQKEFATQTHIKDLKDVTKDLGFNYDKADGSNHLELSPEGKRSALANAHLKARNESGKLFG